jgi:hypothetical protein
MHLRTIPSLLLALPHGSHTVGVWLFQEPVPTITPTPQWMQEITLQPGVSLLLERQISYGDIAVVVAIIALVMVILFSLFMILPRFWRPAK